MRKYLLAATVMALVAILFLGVGCMERGETVVIPLQDHVLEYLRLRYPDDTFSFMGRVGGGPGIAESQILVGSEKFPDSTIMVTHNVVDGKEIFGDNYVYLLYEEQTRELLDEILRSVFTEEFRLFYSAPLRVRTLSDEETASFEGFIGVSPMLDFVVITAPGYEISDRGAFETKIQNAFLERGVHISSASVHLPDDSVSYEEFRNARTVMDLSSGHSTPGFGALGLGSEDVWFDWKVVPRG